MEAVWQRGVVVILAVVGGQIGEVVRLELDGVPGDAAVGVVLIERPVTHRKVSVFRFYRGDGKDLARVGIPLGDEAFRKGHVDGHGGFAIGVEIEDGSFHADGAEEALFQSGAAEMFDERWKVGRTGEGEPFDGAAVVASDRGEGAPFVGGEVGIGWRGLSTKDAREKDGESEREDERHEDAGFHVGCLQMCRGRGRGGRCEC